MHEINPLTWPGAKRDQIHAGNIRLLSVVICVVFVLQMFSGATLFSQSRVVREGGRTAGFPGDTEERSRPPKPIRQRDDLHFPPGFLQHSPSSESKSQPSSKEDRATSDSPASSDTSVPKDKPARVEPPRDDTAPNIEPVKARDDTILLGIIVSAALLGLFVFADYRYRCWLQTVLLQNNRLLSPEAAVSDFDEVFMATGTLPLSFAGSMGGIGYSGGMPSFFDYEGSDGFVTATGLSGGAVSLPLTSDVVPDGFFAREPESE